MARRPSRKPADQFDPELVALIEGLFQTGAQTRKNEQLIFPKGANRKFRPGKVRELYGLTESDFSNWKYKDWEKAGIDKPLEVSSRLIGIFSGKYSALVGTDPNDVRKADSVYEHWQEYCRSELETAVRRLNEHHDELKKQSAKRPFNKQQSAHIGQILDHSSQPSGSTSNEGVATQKPPTIPSSPTDLLPPPWTDYIARPIHLNAMNVLASRYFGTVIQGRAKSGKSYIAFEYISGVKKQNRVLWYNLGTDTVLSDVFARMALLPAPLATSPGQELSNMVDWLHSTSTILVLDGIDDQNRQSFSQFLQLISKLPGPSRVIVTSSVKTSASNTHEIGSLTFDEASALLAQFQVKYDLTEIRQSAAAGDLWPYTIKKSAAVFNQINRETLVAARNILNSEIVEQLPLIERKVMEILQTINAEFDSSMVTEILDELKYDISANRLLNRFQTLFLVKQISATVWRLESDTNDLSTTYVNQEQMADVLLRLSRHYEARVNKDGRLPSPKELTLVDCMNLFASCRLLQIAQTGKNQRERLLRTFSRFLERHGAFKQLGLVYKQEIVDNSADGWIKFRYARVLYATGKYKEAFDVLDSAFHEIANITDNLDEDLYISILRLVSEICIEVGHSQTALKILDGVLEHAEIANITGTVGIQTVSVLSWALAKAGMPEECIELNDDILDKRFGGLTIPFSKAVSNIRNGIALRQLGRLPKSVSLLREASDFFGSADARAYGWSTMNLALSLHLSKKFSEAQDELKKAIEINAAHNLFSSEMGSTYDIFLAAEQYKFLRPSIESEMQRINTYETERRGLGPTIGKSRLIEHIFLDLGVDQAAAYKFDKAKYELFSLSHPHAIRSKFNQNLIRSLRKENVEQLLDNIFASNSTKNIFRSHIYNRIIINACNNSSILNKKYIYPNIEIIQKQIDSVLFSYARYFEGVGDIASAERLLERVRKKNCFNYYNIKANCASEVHPLDALKLNEEALSHCQINQQKAQILHNKAKIMYNHRMRAKFGEAKELCEESIRCSTKRGFFWPRNLLLKLNLVTCKPDEMEKIILQHQKRFNISLLNLRKVVSEIEQKKLRETALSILGKINLSGAAFSD